MSANIQELYRDILMEHYKYPRGSEKLEKPDIENDGQNPLCGDSLTIQLKLAEDIIEDISCLCQGCAICKASGSMLTEIIEGKSLEETKKIAVSVKKILKGEEAPADLDYEDLEALEGVKKFPVRIKCALLSWITLMEGISAWEENRSASVVTTE